MFKIGKKSSDNLKGSNAELAATASLIVDGDSAKMSISGNWLLKNKRTPLQEALRGMGKNIKELSFDTSSLGSYDSSLLCLLLRCCEICSQTSCRVDIDSLPDGPKKLLKLATAVPEIETTKIHAPQRNVFGEIGRTTLGYIGSMRVQAEFIGEVTIACFKAAMGKARYRLRDLLLVMQRAGPEAFPIVALISFLVGMILAFVGGIQLAKYGSEIFVADLVAIAMCREMGAIMVGIVMAGRTGASFAAELGSMKVNEEISAFRTFGLSPIEFLVFPRILALVLMFPLLTIFADLIGILGGLAIGLGLNLGFDQYINRTYASLNLIQVCTGVGKSFIFGIIVACIGCKMGLKCENSSAGVGMATTSSVVQSITWIIVVDAIFAVIFTIFDI